MKLAGKAPSASIPERLGKHRIVGKLATGGMASVFLARLVGPAGFENVVVIKRMLPHLAEDVRFREMFADEARTVARIRHPNVVRTFELVSEDEELYLVMEYLEGETLQRLSHALAAQGEALSFGLACHVVAEAAAGLHAAHELKSEDGSLLGVVHRDVSPHNIFVTLDGSVKVIDFGIAKSVDRTGSTSTGELKGKFAYMSPEQVAGKSATRRTDVFALGVTLWELLTGKRLFARENQMVTLRAVTDEESPAPSTIAHDVPPAIDAICARCLTKDPTQRYATAAELRRDLLSAMRQLGEHDPGGELARLMQTLFETTIAKQRNMLREARAGELPPLQADREGNFEVTVDEAAPDPVSHVRRSDATVPLPHATRGAPPPAKRSGLLVGLGLAALVLGLSAGGYAWYAGSSPPPPATSTVAVPPAVPDPPAPPEPDPTPVPEVARVTITIESDPPGALVTLDGIARGNTPVIVELPEGDVALPLELSLEGRRTTTTRMVPDHDQTLRLTLPRASRGGRSGGRTERDERGGFFAFE